MIVFGHNNFKIKTFNFRDLKLPADKGWEDVTFEVRQRYAHLFWIPFFPIGKLWGMKKRGGGNDLYEMPGQIKLLIEQRHADEIKTPWYSWSLFLIAIVGGAIFMVGGVYNDHARANRNEFRKNEEVLMIKYPTTGDYYKMRVVNDSGRSGTSHFKVKSYTDEDITLISLKPDLSDNEYVSRNSLYRMFDLVEVKGYNEFKVSKSQFVNSFKERSEMKTSLGEITLEEVIRRSLTRK